MRTSDNFHLLGREENESESRFFYHDGYYEGIEQEFRGFGAADAVAVGDFNHPTSQSRTRFLQGRRPAWMASNRLADNPNEALKGREYLSEVFDERGTYLSTDRSVYRIRRLAMGLNGVAVSYAYVQESRGLRYDNAPFTADGTPHPLTLLVQREDLVDPGVLLPGEELPPDEAETFFIRGARRGEVRSTWDSVDHVGSVLEQTAHGRVLGEFGEDLPDETVVSTSLPVNLPNAEDGWLWRTERGFVHGHGSTTRLDDTDNDFNGVGDLTRSEVFVTQEQLPLFDGVAVPHENLLSTSTYDGWGNVLSICGGDPANSVPCLRQAEVDYDLAYAQFPEAERVDVSPGGDLDGVLQYTATWDRGFSVITQATDPNGFTTDLAYDGLSRPTAITPPDEAGCSGTGQPVTRIAYHLSGQVTEDALFAPETVPVSRIVTTTQLSCTSTPPPRGPAPDATDILQSINYLDGLGRARAVLATGDEHGNTWIKSGVVTFDQKGTARRAYQPAFFTADADAFDTVVALPEVPSVTSRYDTFGRTRASVAEDGSATWTSYHGLSTDACDPNDLDARSPHYRTCVTARVDGHGRVIDQIQRNRQADRPGLETYRLWTDYRADNAVVQIGRGQTENDAPRLPDVVQLLDVADTGKMVEREFFYDSVARRITATDPDTDNRDAAAGEESWRYLFNRVGDLVAVRDPRGCGQDFFYDRGGRLLGERYIACAEAEAHELPHAEATLPADVVGFGLETVNEPVHNRIYFDAYPEWTDATGALPINGETVDRTLAEFPELDARPVLGRQTGMTDRGQRCAYATMSAATCSGKPSRWPSSPRAKTIPTRSSTGSRDPSPLHRRAADPAAADHLPPTPSRSSTTRSIPTSARWPTTTPTGRPPSSSPAIPTGTGRWARPSPDPASAERCSGTAAASRGAPTSASGDGGMSHPVHTADSLTNGGVTIDHTLETIYPVIQYIEYLRDALVARTVYGDGDATDAPIVGPLVGDRIPGRSPTESTTDYDIRRRPIRMRTTREPTGLPDPGNADPSPSGPSPPSPPSSTSSSSGTKPTISSPSSTIGTRTSGPPVIDPNRSTSPTTPSIGSSAPSTTTATTTVSARPLTSGPTGATTSCAPRTTTRCTRSLRPWSSMCRRDAWRASPGSTTGSPTWSTGPTTRGRSTSGASARSATETTTATEPGSHRG